MADTTKRLRNALTRAGFQVQTRPTTVASSKGGSVWSVRGHGIARNNLTQAQAQAILDAYNRGEYE